MGRPQRAHAGRSPGSEASSYGLTVRKDSLAGPELNAGGPGAARPDGLPGRVTDANLWAMTQAARIRSALAIAFALTGMIALPVRSAPGDLDPSFSGNGIHKVPAGDFASFDAVARQGSKLIAAGGARVGGTFDAFVVRFTSGGDLDPTFGGGDGMVRVGVGPHARLFDVAVLPSGKILGAGVNQGPSGLYRFLVMRFKPDGGLDTNFGGGDGIVFTTFNGESSLGEALVVLPDGRFAVCGQRYTSFDETAIAIARYMPSGALDSSFGGDGKVVTILPGYQEHSCMGIGVDDDGYLVAGGDVAPPGPGSPTAAGLARYRPNGKLDDSFNAGGSMVIQAGLDTFLDDVLVLPSGSVLFSGQYRTLGGKYRAYVSKVNSEGDWVTSFANGGWRDVAVPGGDPVLKGLALDPDGKVVAAGEWSDNDSPYFEHVLVVRLKPGGSFDTAFGGDGIVRFRMTMTDDSNAQDVLVQNDGRIVIVGEADPDAGIARLLA